MLEHFLQLLAIYRYQIMIKGSNFEHFWHFFGTQNSAITPKVARIGTIVDDIERYQAREVGEALQLQR